MNTTPPALSNFKSRITWDNLDKDLLESHLKICAEEDLGKKFHEKNDWELDITTRNCRLMGSGSAQVMARESMIICGLMLIPLILKQFTNGEVSFTTNCQDGQSIGSDQIIGQLEGPENEILIVERTLLNFLQRIYGIATKAKKFVRIIEDLGVGLLDTRKTTPGLRLLEKYASGCGGSYNHRIGLFDRILIKDNHLAAAGVSEGSELEKFLHTVVQKKEEDVIVEVEIDQISQIHPAIQSGVDAVLLDNFTPENINRAVQEVQNKVVVEVSGGITEASIKDYAMARPHFISTGAPIHSGRWVDIGLDWK